MTLTEALVAGLLVALAGAGHCLGMCGAISVTLGFALPEDQRVGRRLWYWHGLFATGRLFSYTLLGAVAGGVGEALRLSVPGGARLVLALAAVIMVMVAAMLIGRDLGLQWLERAGLNLWRKIQPLLRHLLPVRHAWQALLVGMGWGLLPCGLIYTSLLLAGATGDPGLGALLMLAFGLVTVVPVTGTGLVVGSLPWLRSLWWRRSAALLSLGFGVWLLIQVFSDGHMHEPTSMPVETPLSPHQHLHPSHR